MCTGSQGTDVYMQGMGTIEIWTRPHMQANMTDSVGAVKLVPAILHKSIWLDTLSPEFNSNVLDLGLGYEQKC